MNGLGTSHLSLNILGATRTFSFYLLSYCLHFGDVEMSIVTKGRKNECILVYFHLGSL